MGTTIVRQLNDRYYRLFTPTGVAANAPLFISIHPGLSNAEHWQETCGIDAVAEAAAEPFYVAYPYGSGFFYDNPYDGVTEYELVETWNVGRAAGLSFLLNMPDMDFLKRMYHHILNTQSIDSTRVGMGGFSNGGHATYSYACRWPEDIQFGLILAGALMMDHKDVEDEINLPITHIHSQVDEIVAYAGATPTNYYAVLFSGVVPPVTETKEFMESKGCTFELITLTSAGHSYASANAELTATYGKTYASIVGEKMAAI